MAKTEPVVFEKTCFTVETICNYLLGFENFWTPKSQVKGSQIDEYSTDSSNSKVRRKQIYKKSNA